jgi:hypothetical protein
MVAAASHCYGSALGGFDLNLAAIVSTGIMALGRAWKQHEAVPMRGQHLSNAPDKVAIGREGSPWKVALELLNDFVEALD